MGIKHTPGPWERGSALGVVAGTGGDLRIVFQPYTDGANGPVLGLSEKVANTNLAAAAPELLEALEAVLEELREDATVLEEEYGKGWNWEEMLQEGKYPGAAKAIKAIAKAKGETEA